MNLIKIFKLIRATAVTVAESEEDMTAYQTNMYRHMKEDYEKYSRFLEIEEKRDNPNRKVTIFLRRYLNKLDEMIKSYE